MSSDTIEKRLLHVDPDPTLLDRALDARGWGVQIECSHCQSAATAHEHLASGTIDCVVTGLELPDADGFDFLETLATSYPDIPVVVLDDRPPAALAADAFAAGAAEYVQKRPDADELLAARLGRVLAVSGSDRAIDGGQAASTERKRRREQIERLHRVGMELASCESRNRVYELMVDAGEDIIDLDMCVVFIVEDGEFEHVASSSGISAEGYHEPAVDSSESGLMGETFRTGESILVGDTQSHPNANPQAEYGSGVSAAIGEFGIFQAMSLQTGTFDQTDLELVELLAGHVREALRRLDREEAIQQRQQELRQQREQIKRLHEVGLDLARCDSRERACGLMVEAAEDILGIDLCLVGLVEDGWLDVVAKSEALPEDGYHEPRMNSEEAGLIGKAYRTGESMYQSGEQPPEANPQDEYRSSFTVPIGEFGVFQAASYEVVAFDQTDIELVEVLAGHVREALQRLDHEREIQDRQHELELLRQVFSRVFRHNVRNELNVIKGNANIVQRSTDGETRTEAAEAVMKATERLLEQTEKAREIDQVVSTDQTLVTGELRTIVATAVEECVGKFPDADIGFGTIHDVTVRVHPRLGSGIRNAIENAIEHNDDVQVTVDTALDERTGTATIVVEDTGGGIPEPEQRVINDEEETALSHGSGVGLWLLKWVVEKSNGDIRLTNTEAGARVEMTVSLA